MYTHKLFHECRMPECDQPLSALAFVGTLKPSPHPSNTEDLARLVPRELAAYGVERQEVVRLVDHHIPPGLDMRMGPDDEWPYSDARN